MLPTATRPPGKLLVSRVFCRGHTEIPRSVGFAPFDVLCHMHLNPRMYDLVYVGDKPDGPAKNYICGTSKEADLKQFACDHEVSYFSLADSAAYAQLVREVPWLSGGESHQRTLKWPVTATLTPPKTRVSEDDCVASSESASLSSASASTTSATSSSAANLPDAVVDRDERRAGTMMAGALQSQKPAVVSRNLAPELAAAACSDGRDDRAAPRTALSGSGSSASAALIPSSRAGRRKRVVGGGSKLRPPRSVLSGDALDGRKAGAVIHHAVALPSGASSGAEAEAEALLPVAGGAGAGKAAWLVALSRWGRRAAARGRLLLCLKRQQAARDAAAAPAESDKDE